jgi:hypothetical protein
MKVILSRLMILRRIPLSGEDLVQLLSGKRTTDAPKRGSLSTHDCSCTSLFKRIIGSCFTAAFAANRDAVHVIVG